MTAEEHLVELRSIIKRFEEEYRDAVSKALSAREDLDKVNETLKEAQVLLEKRKSEVALEILSLDAELSTERDAITGARADKVALEDTNAKLKVENTRLESENIKYREYESQAMKALIAKEESLKAREFAVKESEQFLANRTSLLPKRD